MSDLMLEVRGVRSYYGRIEALKGISIEVRRGEIVTLIGANGAGKSTLLGILSTLVRPTAGTVEYRAGGAPRRVDDALRREIGVLAHASLCYGELDAIENLRFFGGLYGVADLEARIAALLDEVGLEPRARTRPARTYSRGMTQRLSLARALLARPSLVLLDEPFTGLDRGGAVALGRRLAEVKATGALVLVVTHDLEAIAGVVDLVTVLRRGRVALQERRAGGWDRDALEEAYARHAG